MAPGGAGYTISSPTRLNGTLRLRHRHRGPVDLGGDGPLLDAALHHGDAQRDFDGGRRSGRAGNDAALDADPRGDLAAAAVQSRAVRVMVA